MKGTYAIIQARMGSSRLPGKVLADIHGKPMIWWMMERLYQCESLDGIILATTLLPADDELVSWFKENTNIPVFRGNENDLVDRYLRCSQSIGANIIVRITADDPLKDATIIDQCVEIFHENARFDYLSNCLRPSFPEGLDVEVFSQKALKRVWEDAKLASDREHLTTYMINHPDKFNLGEIRYHRDLSSWRWTVDKAPDLELMRAIFHQFRESPTIHFERIIDFLDKRPDLVSLNQGTVRMEGYKKSLSMEIGTSD